MKIWNIWFERKLTGFGFGFKSFLPDNLRKTTWLVLKTNISVEKESVIILVQLGTVIVLRMKWIWIPKENMDRQWNATFVMSGKQKWQKCIIQTRTGIKPIKISYDRISFYFREDFSNRSRNILMSDSDSDSAYASNNSSLLNRSWPWILHPYCASNCHVTAFFTWQSMSRAMHLQ